MSAISSSMGSLAESVAAYSGTSGTAKKTTAEEAKEKDEMISVKKTGDSGDSTETKKVSVSGRTIGNPQLTEKAAKYYEELKKKFSNMDFILVSTDQKEYAKANASKYGNASRMVVLIDEEKIERMAEDENYRKQYEAVISKAASGLSQLKQQLASRGMNVKSCGIKVNDNGAASFFATMDKSFKAQRKKQQEKQAAKKAAKKAEEKKAQKEKQKERLEKSREDQKADEVDDDDGEFVFEADSIDELLEKIENGDYTTFRNDNVISEEEKQVGTNFDFKI